MKYTKLYPVMSVLMALTFASCGSGTGGDSASSLSSIEDLPRATAPVVDSSSGLAAALGFKNAASTGIVLGDLSETTFDTSSSIAACETTNKFRDAISSAAFGDMILCFVQNSVASNPDLGVDMYDGDFHVIGLNISNMTEEEEGGAPSKIKIRITKEGDAITDFTMFACGDTGDSDTQIHYVRQTIGDDGSFTMESKGIGQDSDGSGADQVTVTGELNADGQFTSKTIVGAHVWSNSEGDSYGEGTVVQESNAIVFNGYDVGSYSNDNGTGSYVNRGYARAQLIDPNEAGDDYNIQVLAIGDGAAHAIMSGESTAGEWTGTWGDDVVQGWNGDTKMEDSEAAADYLTVVEGQDPVAAGDEPTIAFEDDESYDCGDTPVATIDFDMPAMEAACSNYNFEGDWINCWEVTGQNN